MANFEEQTADEGAQNHASEGRIVWESKGGKLYGSLFLIASIAIAYYAYRRSHKDVNITAEDVNLKLAGTGALLIPDKGHINNIMNQ